VYIETQSVEEIFKAAILDCILNSHTVLLLQHQRIIIRPFYNKKVQLVFLAKRTILQFYDFTVFLNI